MSFITTATSSQYGAHKYFGTEGRVDYKFRPASQPPDSVNPMTSLTHFLIGDETGGAYGASRQRSPSSRAIAPLRTRMSS